MYGANTERFAGRHPHATQLVTKAQKLVTFFRASHQPLAHLNKVAAALGIKRSLITSNKTRFTSVHACLESVVRLQSALTEVARQHKDLLSAAVLSIIDDLMFFAKLKQICQLLEPFTLVITAVQAARTTLADVMRYWLYLAKQMTRVASQDLPPEFKAHCFMAYNLRHEEMVSPLCKLALFLHPVYRDVVSSKKDNWKQVQITAGELWDKGYGKPSEDTLRLLDDVKHYKIHAEPYHTMPLDGDLDTLKTYWKAILDSDKKAQLPQLAMLLLDIKPHAADPEKTVSLMGWFSSGRRCNLLSTTTTNMTIVKMHQQCLKPK